MKLLFLGAICKPLSRCWCCTLLPCRKLSLLESLAMCARNCGMSWEEIVKGLGDNHGPYRGATCSLLGTLFLAVCVCVCSHQNFPECIFIFFYICCSYIYSRYQKVLCSMCHSNCICKTMHVHGSHPLAPFISFDAQVVRVRYGPSQTRVSYGPSQTSLHP